MLKRIWAIALQACLLAATPAFAQDRAGTAEELVRNCGLWAQFANLEPQVRQGFGRALSKSRPKPSAAEAERLVKVIKSAYDASRLQATAVRVVAKGLDERHVGELKRWYASATGIAITRLEERASSEADEMMAQGELILGRVGAPRRELLADIVREGKVAESTVELVLGSALAIQRGVMAANPDAPRMTAAEIRAALAPQRPALLEAYGKLAVVNAAVTYESLSDDQLQSYEAFLQSAAGQHFNDLVLEALNAALSEAAEELGRGLPGTKDSANS